MCAFRRVELSRQVQALCPLEVKRERNSVVARPPCLAARFDARRQVTERGFVRGRRFRPTSRREIQTRKRRALVGMLDEGTPYVQVIDDLEQTIFRHDGTAFRK